MVLYIDSVLFCYSSYKSPMIKKEVLVCINLEITKFGWFAAIRNFKLLNLNAVVDTVSLEIFA